MPRIYTARASSSASRAHAREVRGHLAVTVLRRILCGIVALVLLLLEDVSFSVWGGNIGGGDPVPFLLPAWVAIVGLFVGADGGAWFGAVIGLFANAAGSGSIYVLPLVFCLIGLSSGMLGRHVLRRRFAVWLFCDAVVCVFYAFCRVCASVVAILVNDGMIPPIPTLARGMAKEATVALLLTVLLYFPAKWIFGQSKKTPEDEVL